LDKRKVITAYRKGFITIQECAQILGIDSKQIISLVTEPMKEDPPDHLRKQSIH
jgi:hypothetical protein